MSLNEVKLFVKAASKKQAVRQMQFITGVALGAQGDSKGIKKTIKELQQVIDNDDD